MNSWPPPVDIQESDEEYVHGGPNMSLPTMGSAPLTCNRNNHRSFFMATTVADIMAHSPTTVPSDATITEVARQMRANDIGDVLVVDGGRLAGIVTDRDIVIRIVAENKDLNTPVREACSDGDLVTVTPNTEIEEAAQLMRRKAIRRLPVVDGDRPALASSALATSPSSGKRPQRWPTSAPRNPISKTYSHCAELVSGETSMDQHNVGGEPVQGLSRRKFGALGMLAVGGAAAGLTVNAGCSSPASTLQRGSPASGKSKVGFVLSHEQYSTAQLVEFAVATEHAGFSHVWASDHLEPWQHNEGHSAFPWLTWGWSANARELRFSVPA